MSVFGDGPVTREKLDHISDVLYSALTPAQLYYVTKGLLNRAAGELQPYTGRSPVQIVDSLLYAALRRPMEDLVPPERWPAYVEMFPEVVELEKFHRQDARHLVAVLVGDGRGIHGVDYTDYQWYVLHCMHSLLERDVTPTRHNLVAEARAQTIMYAPYDGVKGIGLTVTRADIEARDAAGPPPPFRPVGDFLIVPDHVYMMARNWVVNRDEEYADSVPESFIDWELDWLRECGQATLKAESIDSAIGRDVVVEKAHQADEISSPNYERPYGWRYDPERIANPPEYPSATTGHPLWELS